MYANEESIWTAFREKKYEKAFEALVDLQQEQLLRLILRMVGNQDDAMDVLQETFIKIWKNLKNFKGDSKWSTWTYRIASNEALMHLRKVKKMSTTSDPAIANQLESSSYFDGDAAIRALYHALDTLPAKQRLVFQMKYFDDLPYAEIASITGTSEGALKASYHHAVKKIEKEVSAFKPSTEKSIIKEL